MEQEVQVSQTSILSLQEDWMASNEYSMINFTVNEFLDLLQLKEYI